MATVGNPNWSGAIVTQAQVGFAETKAELDRRAELEKLRETWAQTKPVAQQNKGANLFRKTGPMEYEALSKESLEILTRMLDILQLGYTVNTVYTTQGAMIERWTISIYDPATMSEIAT